MRKRFDESAEESAIQFMDEMNEYFRATLLARQTVERLQREGHSREQAKRKVANVINAEEFAIRTRLHSFDEARFGVLLAGLP